MAAIVLLSGPRWGHGAEPSPIELEAARKLFDEGVHQEEAGDWAGALATFRKVAAVRESPAVHFHLGLCLEKTGKWVEARSEFLAAERTASDKTIADRAREHAEDLRKRMPSVVVVPPPGVAGVSVTIDGQAISSALTGAQIPLDPGKHHIEARATGYRSDARDIELAEREVERVQLAMPRDGAVVDAPPAPAGSTGTRFGAWPWIATGVAGVSLASAGIFYAMRAGEASHLEDVCTASTCDHSERDSYDRGRAYTTAGNVLLVVGSVAAVSAITLFVFNRESTATTAAVAASPRGVTFTLSF